MSIEWELAALLSKWPEASEQVESAPGETCLTADEIVDFVDGTLDTAERPRVLMHLSQCSFCTRETGALFRAARDFDDRLRVKQALGRLTNRVAACLRIFVEETRGAFTRADALLQGLTPPARLDPVLAPAAFGLAGMRGEGTAAANGHVGSLWALREATLHAQGISEAELLFGEENGGRVLLSLDGPCEVRLVAPDGSAQPVEVRRGVDRYYAAVTGMPPGDYLLAILQPTELPPSPPPA
jgi:anti-sigma factor RsiW